MKALGLAPLARLAFLAPLAVRMIVGIIMAAHGFQKLFAEPAGFGQDLTRLGIPASMLMAWLVTFVQLVGGLLLIIGFLSRHFALLLTINLLVALLLVKVDVGLIAPPQSGAGAELNLALIAGFLVILFAGPGKLSLDYALGIEGDH